MSIFDIEKLVTTKSDAAISENPRYTSRIWPTEANVLSDKERNGWPLRRAHLHEVNQRRILVYMFAIVLAFFLRLSASVFDSHTIISIGLDGFKGGRTQSPCWSRQQYSPNTFIPNEIRINRMRTEAVAMQRHAFWNATRFTRYNKITCLVWLCVLDYNYANRSITQSLEKWMPSTCIVQQTIYDNKASLVGWCKLIDHHQHGDRIKKNQHVQKWWEGKISNS